MMAPLSRAVAGIPPIVEERAAAPSLRGDTYGKLLSPREFECLRLYAHLGRWADVAAALGLGSQTVKNHVYAAYRKLGVTHAAAAWLALGWMSIPGDEPRARLVWEVA